MVEVPSTTQRVSYPHPEPMATMRYQKKKMKIRAGNASPIMLMKIQAMTQSSVSDYTQWKGHTRNGAMSSKKYMTMAMQVVTSTQLVAAWVPVLSDLQAMRPK